MNSSSSIGVEGNQAETDAAQTSGVAEGAGEAIAPPALQLVVRLGTWLLPASLAASRAGIVRLFGELRGRGACELLASRPTAFLVTWSKRRIFLPLCSCKVVGVLRGCEEVARVHVG